MKKIKLTQDRLACVDDEDFAWLSQWNWHYWRGKRNKTGYALRNRSLHLNQQRQIIRMQIVIAEQHGLWKPGKEVDHINTCGCDNRKENLRLATRNGQGANQGLRLDNTSGITGVNWHKASNKWRTYIVANGKHKHLGLYEKFNEAVKIRRKAEIEYFGKFQHDPTNVCPLGSTGECPECAARLKELQNV